MTIASATSDATTVELEFDDNRLLPQLFGSHNSHLARIEQELEVELRSRGNAVTITGPAVAAEVARNVLSGLYSRLEQGAEIDPAEVDGALRMAEAPALAEAPGGNLVPEDLAIQTRKRQILPRSQRQAAYLEAIDNHDLVFGLGPAGTGKTYLAVAKAVESLIRGEIDRIVLSRPAVESTLR